MQLLTPWEKATNVTSATRQGQLPAAYAWHITAGSFVVGSIFLWPVLGVLAIPLALIFGRMLALDITTYTLPNIYTVPLLTVGIFHALLHSNLASALIACLLIMLFSHKLTYSSLNIGIGGGDIKLLAALFAFLPVGTACWAIAAGCMLWMPVAFIKPKAMIPFGVPLILGWAILLRFPYLPNWLLSSIS